MASTYLNDAGTWRRLRKIHINDAGTWRALKKVYVNDAGTWRTVFQSNIEGLLTVGTGNSVNSEPSLGYQNQSGLDVFGAIDTAGDGPSPGVLAALLYEYTTATAILAFSGFSSDPGSNYITQVTLNGVARTAAAASYLYGAGGARWSWSATDWGGIGFGSSYPFLIEFP